MINFNWIDNLIPYFKLAQNNLNNKNIFFVWWIIRDILLNLKKDNFEDVDITLAWNTKDVFSCINQNAWSIFKTDKFWTITIVDKEKKCQYEITPFRTEWNYSDARHPDELNWSNSLLDDSIRRDFTMNCIYYTYLENWKENIFKIKSEFDKQEYNDEKIQKYLKKHWFVLLQFKSKPALIIIQNNELIEKIVKDGKVQTKEIENLIWEIKDLHIIFDPQWWINDILKNKIKAVWNPDNRIQEDALRIIRAIRFVSILNQNKHINLDFDSKTWLALKKYYFLINKVAKERVIKEMKKVFKKWNAFWFISLMDELNILKYFFPALYNCKNDNQPTRYHPFDTYSHTILCLYHLQQINTNYLVRFWILYHDVWKPDQYYWASIKKDEQSQQELYKLEINHPIIWKELAKKDFSNLWFSKKEVEEISFYVRYHMFPWELMFMSENKQIKEIKKFISEYGLEKLINLCDITIWDRVGQYNPLQHSDIEWVFDLKEKINKIYEESGRITLKELEINWHDLMKLWFKWVKIWKILNKLLNLVLEEKIENTKEKLLKEAKKFINK